VIEQTVEDSRTNLVQDFTVVAEYYHPDQSATSFLNWYGGPKIEDDKDFHLVDLKLIKSGKENRGTVMLRNIPNTMTLVDLVTILNMVVKGKYDFVYLRVDFSNQHNVGYAFINFTEPKSIVPFCDYLAGTPWVRFLGHKYAQVCFATCQNVDNLIAKFRNSAVMSQWYPFRPHLYDARGDECAFPRQNSIYTASHCVLYPLEKSSANIATVPA
jgi:hypothetical protein